MNYWTRLPHKGCSPEFFLSIRKSSSNFLLRIAFKTTMPLAARDPDEGHLMKDTP